jgi:hypothetical protein
MAALVFVLSQLDFYLLGKATAGCVRSVPAGSDGGCLRVNRHIDGAFVATILETVAVTAPHADLCIYIF